MSSEEKRVAKQRTSRKGSASKKSAVTAPIPVQKSQKEQVEPVEEEKGFIHALQKRYKSFRSSPLFIVVRVVLIALAVIILATSLFEFRYFVLDDLSISITPVQSRIVTNSTPSFEFVVKTNAFSFCSSECSLSLTDTYTGKVHRTEQTLSAGIAIPWSYQINTLLEGYQERIYTFEVQCQNNKNFLCKESIPRYRSAVVSVTKEYSDEELVLKEQAEVLLRTAQEELFMASNQQDYYNELLDSIELVASHDMSRKDYLDDFYELLSVYREHYSEQGFTSVKSMSIPDIEEEIVLLMGRIEAYNEHVVLIRILGSVEFQEAHTFFVRIGDERARVLEQLYVQISAMNSSSFEEFSALPVRSVFDRVHDVTLNASNEQEAYEQEYRSLIELYAGLFSELNLTDVLCSDARSVERLVEEHNRAVIEPNPELAVYVAFVAEHLFVVRSNETHLIADDVSLLNTPGLSVDSYRAFIRYPVIDTSYCQAVPPLPYAHKEISTITIPLRTTSTYEEVQLLEPAQKCCVYEECSACGQAPSPVIFIHGHSFNKDNPAESSIQTFSWMQQALAEEGVIINAGDIDYTTRAQGILSHMPVPLGMRGTYYTISYYDGETLSTRTRKEDGVEVYSIRLKELIDVALEQTGASQVVIVAHSMGGLVVRNYLMLFGEDYVEKVIQIATPNEGVSGRVERLCTSFGEAKACEDLAQGSVLLSRLNRYEPRVPFYQIMGRGCDTDGEDGDGVVAYERSVLSYAREVIVVEGVCDDFLGSSLHGELLLPEKYPVMVEELARILTS